MVETSNGKNCRDCNKANVCKYQETVVEEVEKLVEQISAMELPLHVNIKCKEYASKSQGAIAIEPKIHWQNCNLLGDK